MIFSPKELRYVVNSKDEYGPNFSGETFSILNERESSQDPNSRLLLK
jgi:hypothetical protein